MMKLWNQYPMLSWRVARLCVDNRKRVIRQVFRFGTKSEGNDPMYRYSSKAIHLTICLKEVLSISKILQRKAYVHPIQRLL